MEKIWKSADFRAMNRIPRMNLVNSLSGFKSVNLIGTTNLDGDHRVPNLSLFSSAVHLGADPALLGLVFRPVVADGKTSRHTFQNLMRDGVFTVNHVHKNMVAAAHQTSASYGVEISEFEAVGLTPQYIDDFSRLAPFVLESRVKMGCRLVETIEIKANNTILVVGEIDFLLIPEKNLTETGHLNLADLETVCVEGLDSYHVATPLCRLPYARP